MGPFVDEILEAAGDMINVSRQSKDTGISCGRGTDN